MMDCDLSSQLLRYGLSMRTICTELPLKAGIDPHYVKANEISLSDVAPSLA